MGICGSQDLSPAEQARQIEDKKRTRAYQLRIARNREKDDNFNKLLLLGAGDSGKSTLFKQMVMIYGHEKKEMPLADRRAGIPTIYNNVVVNSKALAFATYRHGEPETEGGQTARTRIEQLEEQDIITLEIAEIIATFWADTGVQTCYENRSLYQLNDSSAYFFGMLEQIGAEDYIPSTADLLRARVRTTGIVEHQFEIEENWFKMYDVGGQRNERKKWIHCFESVTALLFVAAISEFDQVLYEDEDTNRMSEALLLFNEISNSRWFPNTSIVLFLNKQDLFSEKIKHKNIADSKCFELQAFQGDPRSYHETTNFIKDCFLAKNYTDKEITVHITQATDTENVEVVFNAVKKQIISRALNEAGLA